MYGPTAVNEPPRTIVDPVLTTAFTVPLTTIDPLVLGRFEIAEALPASRPGAIAQAAATTARPSGGWNLVPARRRNGMPA